MTAATKAASHGRESVWHDAECGSYAADLPFWRALAAGTNGPVVDLGAGTGRVAMALAGAGHDVVAFESDRSLLRALAARSRSRGLRVSQVCGDAREPWPAELSGLELVIAPMQFLHLMGGADGRDQLLGEASAALADGGRFAAALLDDAEPLGSGTPDPMPDIREHGGWIHSSLPTAVETTPEGIEIHRLRQLVSPRGTLTEREYMIRLDHLSPDQFEAEALEHGLRPLERIAVAPTADHVGSFVVVLERQR